MPAISVVIPLHNKAATILSTLDSALRQDFAEYEIIVVDDGSQDDGGERVRAIRDPRLTYFHQENAGVSAARNRGIMAAKAPLIAFLDADDLWDESHLSRLMESMQERHVVMGFSNIRMEGGRAEGPRLDAALQLQEIDDYFAFALAHGGYPNMTSGTVVSRDAAIGAGLFTIGVSMGEDVDLWCRLAMLGPVLYTGQLTATYREGATAGEASSYRERSPEFPVFASVFPDWLERGLVPDRLEESAARYAHFLVLEHARQLLDQGRDRQARRVLLRHGRPALDPLRYARRLMRTYPIGRAMFTLSGRGSSRNA